MISVDDECDIPEDVSADKWKGDRTGDDEKDDAIEEAISDWENKKEREKELEEGSFDDKVSELKHTLEKENMTCPGVRSTTDKSEKMAELIGQASELKSGQMEAAPLPVSTCGQRKLQQMLKQGAGMLLNKDLRILPPTQGEKERELKKARYLSELKDVLDGITDEEVDTDLIRMEVDRRMNETEREEKERCGSQENQHIVEDTYDIYWKEKDGNMYMGVVDAYDSGFGSDEADSERIILWKQVASCACSHCSQDQMVQPNFYYYDY
ncbi:uncharacterized protein [Watersipora subatra]|uniref:uncharacterized protein n=1 Tax=Watersipora subatra TaxID=2589382 RepID=UPI00355B71D7